jgi:hypothetical protein
MLNRYAPAAGIFLVFLIAADFPANAQTRFARGQDVSPTYKGWERNGDGSYTLHFGYFNRNAEEEFDVPIGPENNFDSGNGDQGQPTHFYAGRHWWVFNVVVPKDWPKDKRAVWTLTTHGVTNQAKGWLQPEWEMDKGVIFQNSNRDPFLMFVGGEDTDVDADNLPPTLTGSSAETVRVGQPITLSVTATDDGLPKPLPDPTGRRQQGVRIRWIVYRAPGTAHNVRFEPDVMKDRVYGHPVTFATKATFSRPGSYRVRAIASDGQLFGTYDVDLTVLP